MRPADIEHLVELSRPAVAPDGGWAIVATTRPDIRANRAVGQLWRVALPDTDADDHAGPLAAPRRITQGIRDRAPSLTADGTLIGFLRDDDDGRPQVFVVPTDGGEPVQATSIPGGVRAATFSPAGDRIAVIANVVAPGRGSSVTGLSADAQSPRLIARDAYLANGVGWALDATPHVFVVPVPRADREPTYPRAATPEDADDRDADAPVPDAVQVTTGDVATFGIAWDPEGRILAAQQDRAASPESLRSRLVRIDPDAEHAPVTLVGEDANLSLTGGQGILAFEDGSVWFLATDVGATGRDFVARSTSVYRRDADGSIAVLTDEEHVDLGDPGSHLSRYEDGVLAQERRHGRVRLVHVTRTGVTPLHDDAVEVVGHAVHPGSAGHGQHAAARGSRIVVSFQSPTSFGELGLLTDGSVQSLTDFGAELRRAGIVVPDERTVTTRDGTSVHGWVWLPKGEGPHPVLLNIHGGPFAQYGVHVFDEAQVAVDAGYAVVQCNPRGSAGYGRAHGVAITAAMGTVDRTDVLDFLDGVLDAYPALDRDRVGIMGGSYGGYLTAWITAHDHRFRGAIVERGYLDPVSFVGTSDIGWFFSDAYTGTDPQRIAAQSPMAHVHDVTTPTFVIHSERDFRCPLEQAQRYYAALRRQGVPTALLVFPGEDHELTRAGQPRHRVERFAHVLEWWSTHLPVTATNDTGDSGHSGDTGNSGDSGDTDHAHDVD